MAPDRVDASMTVERLRAFARERRINLHGASRKDDIIRNINAALQQSAGAAEGAGAAAAPARTGKRTETAPSEATRAVAAPPAPRPKAGGPAAWRLDGRDRGEWRSILKDLVRDNAISASEERLQRLLRRQQNRDAVTDAPFPDRAPDGGGRRQHEVEHTFECQMMGHAVVCSDAMRPVLTNVDLGASLSRQPVVVRNRLQTIFNVQNGEPNLTLVLHDTNVKKGGAVKSYLNRLDSGSPTERGLEGELVRTFSAAYDEDVASRHARTIVRSIQAVSPVLQSGLTDPSLDGALRSLGVQDRGTVLRQLVDVSDEIAVLCAAMQI